MFISILLSEGKKTKKCNWHLDGGSRFDICGGQGHILQIAVQRKLYIFHEPLSHSDILFNGCLFTA